MTRRVRIRYRIECLLTLASAAALVMSLVSPHWIELTTGVQPDAGTGATEWTLTLGLASSTLLLLMRVRIDRRTLSLAGR
jgi:hypothetical protein